MSILIILSPIILLYLHVEDIISVRSALLQHFTQKYDTRKVPKTKAFSNRGYHFSILLVLIKLDKKCRCVFDQTRLEHSWDKFYTFLHYPFLSQSIDTCNYRKRWCNQNVIFVTVDNALNLYPAELTSHKDHFML